MQFTYTNILIAIVLIKVLICTKLQFCAQIIYKNCCNLTFDPLPCKSLMGHIKWDALKRTVTLIGIVALA